MRTTTIAIASLLPAVFAGAARAQLGPRVEETQIWEKPSRTYFTLGVGAGGLTATDDEDFSQGISATIRFGYRLRPKLHLVFDAEYTMFARYEGDPAMSQQQSAVTLGARFLPLGERRPAHGVAFDPTQLQLTGGLGVGHIIRVPYESLNPFEIDQGQFGPAATVAIGWTPLVSRSWSLGFEVTDSAVLYDDRVRHNLGINLVTTLDLF